jgi:hypothetical protein
MTRVSTIQEPKFSVCGIVFEGGYDGRGCGCHMFLASHAQPSHMFGHEITFRLQENLCVKASPS